MILHAARARREAGRREAWRHFLGATPSHRGDEGVNDYRAKIAGPCSLQNTFACVHRGHVNQLCYLCFGLHPSLVDPDTCVGMTGMTGETCPERVGKW